MHINHGRHMLLMFVHTHDIMYAHVYTCTHCSRKGHLIKFCYDRLNVTNFVSMYVWFRNSANPMDPRKFGYQHPPLLYLM